MEPHFPPPGAILRYLADLAGQGAPDAPQYRVVARARDYAHLGWAPAFFSAASPHASNYDMRVVTSDDVARLRHLDGLHEGEQLLRIGWLWLVGARVVDGHTRRFGAPLLSTAVRVRLGVGSRYLIETDRDLELPAFIPDPARGELTDQVADVLARVPPDRPSVALLERLGTLRRWVDDVAAAAGLPRAPFLDPDISPVGSSVGNDRPAVAAGMGIYLARDVTTPSMEGALLTWAATATEGTAFEALYAGHRPTGGRAPAEEVVSSLPLNAAQREALARARGERITVVSGPPGTGKSHLVAALAIDEVARGNSVLVATQSDEAAGVVAELLGRAPGPRHVRFGSARHRESVAADLSRGLARPMGSAEVAEVEAELDAAGAEAAAARARLGRLLSREAALADGLARRPRLAPFADLAPRVLAPDFDAARARRLIEKRDRRRRLLAGWRRGRLERKVRAATGAGPGVAWEDLLAAVEAGEAEAAVRAGLAGGGLALGPLWVDLERAEARWRVAYGRAAEMVRRRRWNAAGLSVQAVASLAAALRAGRAFRRRALLNLRGGDFLDVLPLWVGTLREIDDTLPVEAGIFDVVIFDEASQIDQLRSAPALARARRAVVVGDPRQLRHVSFLGDEAMEAARRRHGIPPRLAGVLDVRRSSLFDAAAGASPVTELVEHFRSVPHIILFSDRRFYGGRLRLMTQHPGTETRDAIRLVRVEGDRDDRGVNPAEVGAAVGQVERAIAAGVASIGVVSPFRAQAEALEEALLDRIDGELLLRHRVRVGTVHALQGGERDTVIASLALGPADPGNALRFVEDPNLFNVLVTRARREFVVVTSVGRADLPPGLLRDYLKHATEPPLPSEAAPDPDGWVGELAAGLRTRGLRVVAGYPVAGWRVDLAVGEGQDAIGVECLVHDDGPEAHIERHQALRRAGWALTDAFHSRWLLRHEGAVEALALEVLWREGPGGRGAGPADQPSDVM